MAHIKGYGFGWTVFTLLLILILAVLVTFSGVLISNLEGERASIVRWYEDGSGRIELSNGYCMFPAFDSPEDKVVCVKEGER